MSSEGHPVQHPLGLCQVQEQQQQQQHEERFHCGVSGSFSLTLLRSPSAWITCI